MGFWLKDLGAENREIKVNRWNWFPTVELIRMFDLIDEERLEMMHFNAMGVCVTEAEAHEIGRRLKEEILPKLRSNERITYDLSVTDKPDDYTFHREDPVKNFSATYEWLNEFTEFCLTAKGFEVS